MKALLLLLLGLGFATSTARADLAVASGPPFCANPKSSICSQRTIHDDLGETLTNPDLTNQMRNVRAKARSFAKARFTAMFANDDGSKLKKFARLVGYDGYFQTKCWDFSWTSTNCRTAVVDELAKKALAVNTETDDDTTSIMGNGYFTFQKKSSARLFFELLDEPGFTNVVKQTQEIRRRENARPRTRLLAAQIFDELRQTFLTKLRTWPVSEPVKSVMLRRLSTLKYIDNENCDGLEGLPSIYTVQAFNTPEKNTLSICEGLYLKTSSPSSLAMVIAHEIGHTFDPCSIWDYEGGKIRGFKGDLANVTKPTGGLVACLNRQTPKGMATPQCTPADPTRELFADWAAAEVVPAYLQRRYPTDDVSKNRSRYSASYGFLCGSGLSTDDSHPRDSDRINNIIFQSPDVRRLSGCPAPTRHCSFDSKAPAATPAPKRATATGKSIK